MRRAIIVSISLLAVLLGAGCLKISPKKPEAASSGASVLQNMPFQKLEATVATQEAPAEAPSDLEVPSEQPEVKPGETASLSQNVVVSSIVKNQTLTNPFVILGRARAFENQISWRLRDARGKVISDGSALTNAPEVGTFGQYRARAFYDRVPDTEAGTVEVVVVNPANGMEQDLVSVPVKLELHVVPVKAFFSNIKDDPQTLDCTKVFAATRRVPVTQNVAEAAIIELLKGPSTAEQSIGFRTSIFPGTGLRSINLKDGTAIVDFSKEFLYAVAGSCHIQALSAQVEQTLKQFPAVTNVKVLVEGQDAADKIQP